MRCGSVVFPRLPGVFVLFVLACHAGAEERPAVAPVKSPLAPPEKKAATPNASVPPWAKVPGAGRAQTLEEACQSIWDPACQSALPRTLVCPKTQKDVHLGELCGITGRTGTVECTYPEGRCRCIHHPYCGGPTPTMLQQQGMRWECRPPAGPDDCPDAAPGEGSACKNAGKTCGFGGCGTSTSCTCLKKKWQCAQRYWAPPP